jgi:phage gpG-like protein
VEGVRITVKLDDTGIRAALRRMADIKPALEVVGSTVVSSVQRNFEEGGRPVKWKPSKAAQRAGRPTLVDQGYRGGLVGSINYQVEGHRVLVGTNKIYAAIHQLGGRIGARVILPVKGKALSWPGARHPVKKVNWPGATIPARPFLVVQDEDWKKINERISELFLGGRA